MEPKRGKPTMNDYWYPCAFSHWDEEETSAIFRVIASGRYTQGEEVEAFEAEFAAYHGMKYAIAVNSGSSANLVAVAALFAKENNPLKRGDKAIVPALAWATTYAPLVQYGLDLVLADCDGTWNAEQIMGQPLGTRLAVGCSSLGNPAHLKHLAHAEYYINDNCESLGAWYGPLGEKKWTANFGLMSTHSFFWSHQLSAIEGGCILTDDDEMNSLCRMLRDHGMTRWQKPQTFEEEYDFRLMGYNLRWVEMHAAIAREQLKKLETMRRAREANWNNWEVMCRGLPIQIPPKLRNGVRSPFGLNFTVESKDARARLATSLRANGIDCRLPTGGSFRLHLYGAKWVDQETPNADRVHSCGLFLGNSPTDISDKIERAVKVMRSVL